MSIVKPKISSLVSGQLPEFIQEEYQTFVSFLESYYEYLHDNVITDYATVRNIDTTSSDFIKYFKNELAINFPSVQVDDRFLLPRLKELYVSKGSEASIRALFRLLFDKEIIVKYPSKQMLRVSDGKWIQQNSIYISVVSGDINTILGNYINIVSTATINNSNIKVLIDSYQLVPNTTIYELFLASPILGNFSIGDLVTYGSFVGSVKSTTQSVSVVQPGKNFKLGQIYTLPTSNDSIQIKITGVDSNGGIKTASIIKFSPNAKGFTSSITAYANQTSAATNFVVFGGTSPNYTSAINDSITGVSDDGTISLYNYAATGIALYSDPSYVGEILKTFTNDIVVDVDNTVYAILSIATGVVSMYPGYYDNNDGFLSDTIYIQDGKYYQIYSYVVQINKLYDSYKSIVKNTVHPAGTDIIGEYTIDNEFNASIMIEPLRADDYLVTEALNQLITENNNNLVFSTI